MTLSQTWSRGAPFIKKNKNKNCFNAPIEINSVYVYVCIYWGFWFSLTFLILTISSPFSSLCAPYLNNKTSKRDIYIFILHFPFFSFAFRTFFIIHKIHNGNRNHTKGMEILYIFYIFFYISFSFLMCGKHKIKNYLSVFSY